MPRQAAIHLDLSLKDGLRPTAERAIAASPLPDLYARLSTGPFGKTAAQVGALEALVDAAAAGLAASEALRGVILQEAEASTSLTVPSLSDTQRQLIHGLQIVVTTDIFLTRVAAWCSTPDVEGALELDGVGDLLAESGPPATVLSRMTKIMASYTKLKTPAAAQNHEPAPGVGATAACAQLLRAAVLRYCGAGELASLVARLRARGLRVGEREYDGLELRAPTSGSHGLMPARCEDIVGNDAYLQAAMRLARDVAGYDFDAAKNPKRLNPVLFGLGRPGSGKTITAHAVGRYFLDFCRERGIPARFRIIQRTDWASSYQNASARNLVRIFREEVHAFDGVCGVYWPDIDTAFASRGDQGLRAEEKQNLGAVFGVFDGTLLPRDGKWFLLCDANTLHMDEATISRIAQNPMQVDGPTTPEHYTRLMRDIMLADVARFVPSSEQAWRQIGQLAARHALSGRHVESICNNIRTHIQDFDYPDLYFQAGAPERAEIVDRLSRPVDPARILAFIDDFVDFRRDAQEAAAEAAFQREVQTLVRRLNATEAAARQRQDAT